VAEVMSGATYGRKTNDSPVFAYASPVLNANRWIFRWPLIRLNRGQSRNILKKWFFLIR